MAESTVKFFSQRLEYLMQQDTGTFTELEDQIGRLKDKIKEIAIFYGARSNAAGDAAFDNWEKELRNLLEDLDDHVDEFIIQMDEQHGSDRLTLTDCFRTKLQNVESQLSEVTRVMMNLRNSSTIEGEKRGSEEDDEQPCGKEEVPMELDKTTIEGENEQPCRNEEVPMEVDTTTIEGENGSNKEQSDGDEDGQMSAESSSASFRLKYNSLPYYLRSCLMYCCIFPENYRIAKGKLIRLLVAEGLIQEKAGQISEDVAKENINDLVCQGMLQVEDDYRVGGTKLNVPAPHRAFLRESYITPQVSFDYSIPAKARRIWTSDMVKIIHSLNNIRPRALFLFGKQELSEENWLNFTGAKFLRVLDLEDANIKRLPDEVGDLIHLTYLGLKCNDINKLPNRLGNLRALQTLDIRWCGDLIELSAEVLNLARLRHIKMFKNKNICGMKLPEGIGRLGNLLTLTGMHAGGDIARELGMLKHLRRLGVMDVAEENATELYTSIMEMQGLLSLSLEAKRAYKQGHLVTLDSFMPPPLLRKLRLEGPLEKVPNWLGSMECLTKLRLGFSHLSESPTLVLQLLPNLENLILWHAYDGKHLGKEFCKARGFPKLEVLTIASHVLEEWTELEEGALPKLQYLHFHNCSRLRMLPEGLQFVTTLEQLVLLPLLDEHAERLKPDGGEENYKISHIPEVSFMPMSLIISQFNKHFSTPPTHHPPVTHEE